MRIVQCHGCFDLLHIGHIRHFEAAKEAGDILIVTVTPDRFVNKGAGRPVFTAARRAEAIRALRCVDQVWVTNTPTAAEFIREIRPNVFAKGPDYSEASLDPGELQAIRDVGAELLITQTEKWSSTALLQGHAPALSPEVEAYLAQIKAYSVGDVLGWLEKARTLKVLVIGDAIVDEYHYCNTLGKAGKEPILAAQFVKAERFIGGADAVAEHASAVSDFVDCCTGPNVIKRRFVETYPFQKLFEIYEMDEAGAADVGNEHAVALEHDIAEADLVIVADYGHGYLTPALIDTLTDLAKILAVNVQANAGNHGFNTIGKYPDADFVSISERELRLDARDQRTDVGTLMALEATRKGTILVTRGEHGCMVAEHEDSAEAPALSTHTVDRVGAGDAVFGVTACLAAVGAPLDLLTFVAAVVGTMAVGIVGNASYIERESFHAAIATWLR